MDRMIDGNSVGAVRARKVRFCHDASGLEVNIPGFFAADGDAGESSAKAGRQWRVRLTPPGYQRSGYGAGR